MKKFILMILVIINVIFAFSLLLKQGTLIFVNSKNKEMVKEILAEEIENTDNITKIVLRREWNSGVLIIYHLFGKTDKVYVVEGYRYEKIVKYIKQNGINLDKIGIDLLIVSTVIYIYLMLYVALEILIIKKMISKH